MKRILFVLLTAVLVFVFVSCAGKSEKPEAAKPVSSQDSMQTGDAAGQAGMQEPAKTEPPAATQTPDTGSQTGSQDMQNRENIQLLHSASIDLDADGSNEQVEALQVTSDGLAEGDPKELEGILRITGKNGTVEIPFIKKPEGVAGVMSSFEFKDLDGDGAKDVFVVIPDSGAAFSLNYFFIYNYKTGKSYSYFTDSSLSDFAGSFKFEYKGNGLLAIKNKADQFSATFNLNGTDSRINSGDDSLNKAYEGSWVDPVPVEMGDNSRLALVNAGNGMTEIKVPLPVFGLATADIIGEMDLYYQVNADFKPVLKRYEVIDFNGDKLEKIGEHKLN